MPRCIIQYYSMVESVPHSGKRAISTWLSLSAVFGPVRLKHPNHVRDFQDRFGPLIIYVTSKVTGCLLM